MNPFLLAPRERMADWKHLREALTKLDKPAQLERVAHYWSQAPLLKHAYDAFELDHVPGPWEMINEGDWCRDSVAVGMEFTLRLSGWSADAMKLLFIRDYDLSDQMLVLKIETGETLNYSTGEVTDYPTTRHDVMCGWEYSGRGYSTI